MQTTDELALRLAFAVDRYINLMVNEPTISANEHAAYRKVLASEIQAALDGVVYEISIRKG